MDNRTLQTPNIKTNSECVDRATELIIKFTEHIDKCCPSCQALLKSKSGLRPSTTPGPKDDRTTQRNQLQDGTE